MSMHAHMHVSTCDYSHSLSILGCLWRQARPGAELGSVNGARQRARYAHARGAARRSSTQLGARSGGEAAHAYSKLAS
eukprot:scaffold2735_cov58-Phaeocystis_antarctica.AAC.8